MKTSKIIYPIFGLLLAAAGPSLAIAADQAAAEQAIAAAEAARAKAASVDGEWRDTAKFIKTAQALAKEGKFDEAIALANKAKSEGELGYAQAMEQREVADMSLYVR